MCLVILPASSLSAYTCDLTKFLMTRLAAYYSHYTKTLSHRDVKRPIPSHPASKWKSGDVTPRLWRGCGIAGTQWGQEETRAEPAALPGTSMPDARGTRKWTVVAAGCRRDHPELIFLGNDSGATVLGGDAPRGGLAERRHEYPPLPLVRRVVEMRSLARICMLFLSETLPMKRAVLFFPSSFLAA